ncbi:MAG: hypothetical protein LBD16_06195 [Oscillospiraceae bacterium]|jgi:sugar lactone lactonase YvrE|nr:hypothetical protein [Oscillospiraceae bacterium]
MRKIRIAVLLLLLLALPAPAAFAQTPYLTYTRSGDGRMSRTQTAYEPIRTMVKFGGESLKMPSDIRLGFDGNLYICDSGNKRVLVVTREGELVREIGGSKTLKSPTGVFVTNDGNVYVADENGRAVVVFDAQGEVIAEYGKPTHPLFGATAPYKPVKVVVDRRGNLYVNSTGNTNGLVQIAPGADGGAFLGYFGANTTKVSFITRIRKAIFSDEQLSRTAGIVPTSVVNMSIDAKGMIFTVSRTGDVNMLRKLNVAGKNILQPDWYDNYPAAVATAQNGNIYVASQNGYINEYTSEGEILFVFGAYDDGQQRTGLFKSVSGIAVDETDTLYVLDEQSGAVEVFAPTEFCNRVHDAFQLFNDGKYAESKAYWTDILRMNSMFSHAGVGLGEALYREGDYAGAMTAFRNGGAAEGYSDAFWEIRSDWLHKHMGTILIAAASLIVCAALLKRLNHRVRFTRFIQPALAAVADVPIVRKTSYGFTVIKNPFDAAYGILRERKSGYAAAAVLMALYYALYVMRKYFSGFLFKTVPDGVYNLAGDFAAIAVVYLLFVTCCYLVSTITEGEATFQSLCVGTAFALIPVLFGTAIQLALTNVLTYNESFFITLVDVVAYGWSGLLLFLMILYLNDFTIKKTIATVLLTAFTALVFAALAFVVYMLVSQLIDFVVSVYGEVVYRFVRT